MTIGISSEVLDRILAEAAASPDAEICGLLVREGGQVSAIGCANVATDTARRFEIDPAALLATHRAARRAGGEVIGHYHSHPSGLAVPSATDAGDAAPDGAIWLIVAGGVVRAWRAVRDGAVQGRFDPVAMDILPPCMASPGPPEDGAQSIREYPMTISPVDFASILCSRLCHDLLSPVGALNNGLELLADETDPAMRERCMELMTESARTSASKLKFFRLAFGSAGGFGEAIDSRDARAAIEGLHAEGGRVQIDWLVEEERLSKPAAKLLLNLALIAGDALVRGGRLAVGAEEHGGRVEIVIQAEGQRLILPPEIRTMLVEGAGETGVTPRTAAAYLVHATAAEAGGSVQVSTPAENVLLFGVAITAG